MHIHLTPTALAKAKALGIVAAALTAGGAGGMVALSQVSSTGSTQIVNSSDSSSTPSAEPTESESPSPSPTESATDAAAAAPTTSSYALPTCPPDVKNHGAYVSGVAHSAPKGKDGDHGSWVSQAAQSDCGKSADASDAPEPAETDGPESHSPKPTHTKAEKTETPDAAKTVEGGATISTTASTSAGDQHKGGHGGH